jgi:hypothetical protein
MESGVKNDLTICTPSETSVQLLLIWGRDDDIVSGDTFDLLLSELIYAATGRYSRTSAQITRSKELSLNGSCSKLPIIPFPLKYLSASKLTSTPTTLDPSSTR